MTVADDLRQAAVDILAELGRLVDVDVTTGATHNKATGAVTSGTTTRYTVQASPPLAYDLRYVDGRVIRAGDAAVWLAAQGLAFTPEEGQKVDFGDGLWTVVDFETFAVEDVNAAYRLHVRRA
jgi:hypothetical protein